MDPSLIISLVMTVFSGGSLARFAARWLDKELAGKVRRTGSLSEAAEILVSTLSREGRLDALFDALVKEKPKLAADIERVRASVLSGTSTAPRVAPATAESNPAGSEPAERVEWRKRLTKVLDAVPPVVEKPSRPWADAACVLDSFDPFTLHPFPADSEASTAVLALVSSSSERPDGRWSLNRDIRIRSLGRLWQEGKVIAALDANRDEFGKHEGLLRALAEGRSFSPSELRRLPPEELLVLSDLGGWLARVSPRPFPVELVDTLRERHDRVGPLRRLVGNHFRGREQEIARLEVHQQSEGATRIVGLWGNGGVGKSALLGRILLAREQSPDDFPPPWVYLDFDDPAIDPLDPRTLVQEMARQLRLLYASHPGADWLSNLLLPVESLIAGDSFSFTLDAAAGTELQDIVREFANRLKELPTSLPLLVVLDTFEQVQLRGLHPVALVRRLIDELSDSAPSTRFIVSGRVPVEGWSDLSGLHLTDLDAESSLAVLEALGVRSPELRDLIVRNLGTNPLTLRLSAEAARSSVLDVAGIRELERDLALVREARETELQSRLYTRILGHITDFEVRSLAHPGLVVRRVTAEIVRDVLAVPCGLDPARSDQIYAKLDRYVGLFERDDAGPGEVAALRHRQDVRATMLQLMQRDTELADKMRVIHDAAVRHYSGRGDVIARAELLYHRLMQDVESAELDALWSEDLALSLSRSWDEPLPDRSRSWLAPRIGRSEDPTGAKRLADWEAVAAREARSHLMSGHVLGALAVLTQREERTPNSPLFALHAEVLRRLGRLKEARELLLKGLLDAERSGSAAQELRLELLAAEVAGEASDLGAQTRHAANAIRISRRLGDKAAQIRALVLQTRADQMAGNLRAGTVHLQELVHAYVESPAAELLADTDLSRRVLFTVGSDSVPVLRRAATVFGNAEDGGVLKVDPFALGRLLESLHGNEGAVSAMRKMAEKLGLAKDDFQPLELASRAVRFGMAGDAVVLALDHAGEDRKVRSDVLSMINVTPRAGGIGGMGGLGGAGGGLV